MSSSPFRSCCFVVGRKLVQYIGSFEKSAFAAMGLKLFRVYESEFFGMLRFKFR